MERRGEEKVRERKEDTAEDACRKNAKLTIPQTRVCVGLYQPLSLHVSVCVGGPLNSRPFCNPTVQESGEKTPKIPSAINLPPPPLSVCPTG